MKATRAPSAALLLGALVATATALVVGCEAEDPTRAVIDNAYPEVAESGDLSTRLVVYKVWWDVALFAEPVAPGAASSEQRAVPASAVAYALLAPGWDPAGTSPPTKLYAVKSKALVRASRGDTLRISVSDATFFGNCAAGQPLTPDDAAFITERIFPGDFANVTYDAQTCNSFPLGDAAAPADAAASDH